MSASSAPPPYTHDFYRQMLAAGLEAGYQFITFDRLRSVRTSGARLCLLRHDCDNDLVAASEMATIEAEIGIKTTYFVMLRSALYNLLSPPNLRLVRHILDSGHDLGLHFDERPFLHLNPEELAQQVEQERTFLEQQFGIKVGVVSFHQPSQRILDNGIKLAYCLNTYDKTDMAGIYYLSDANMRLKFTSPEAFYQQLPAQALHLLIHPQWWTDQPMDIRGKWNRVLLNQFTQMQDSMLEREDSYCVRQALSVNVE